MQIDYINYCCMRKIVLMNYQNNITNAFKKTANLLIKIKISYFVLILTLYLKTKCLYYHFISLIFSIMIKFIS